jgi:hypothetical protein
MIAKKPRADGFSLEDLPPPYADWPTIREFALSFDGYRHALAGRPGKCATEACGELAERVRAALARPGKGPYEPSLEDLRAALFWEHRGVWSSWDEMPALETLDRCLSLLDRMRERLSGDEEDRPTFFAPWEY